MKFKYFIISSLISTTLSVSALAGYEFDHFLKKGPHPWEGPGAILGVVKFPDQNFHANISANELFGETVFATTGKSPSESIQSLIGKVTDSPISHFTGLSPEDLDAFFSRLDQEISYGVKILHHKLSGKMTLVIYEGTASNQKATGVFQAETFPELVKKYLTNEAIEIAQAISQNTEKSE